ncbi:unnamed protein product [Hyaloperonospora brassicae]|uniref:F-box domain-containing protein n=1 Tax=Hyaloperonospora brassicae TaxID=162125 RepID=A0AAV0USD1_HYABA|nr:unnamed protein product [Hyaloperonospora brassicae]
MNKCHSASTQVRTSHLSCSRCGVERTGRSPRNQMHRPLHWSSLPFDLWAQKVLPFLTWRDTRALGRVCSEWRNVATAAETMSSEWRTTVLGPAATVSKTLDLVRSNASHWVDTRFVPNLILLVAASDDVTPWRRGQFWHDVVAIMEQAKWVPPRCHFIGILTRNAVVTGVEKVTDNVAGDSVYGPPGGVTLSITVAHLSDTTLEMATFDRKMLRRASRTHSFVNPFPAAAYDKKINNADTDSVQPSFLLFGSNDQSASQLTAAVGNWYPGATVVGAVSSSLTDQCIPLATYSTAQAIGTARGSRNRNKVRAPQQRSSRLQSSVAFPSTLLLRLYGHVGIRSFASSGYYPITPVMQCLQSSIADELSQVVTHDVVALLDHENGGKSRQLRVVDVIAPSERRMIEEEGRRVNMYSCQDRAPLEHVLACCGVSESELSAVSNLAQIDRLEVVFWWQGSLMSLSEIGWQRNAYGILASHQPKRTSRALVEALCRTEARLVLASERAFGAFIVAGALNEVEDVVHAKSIGDVCSDVLPMCQLSGCVVSTSVGPVAYPGGGQLTNVAQVQTHTTCGAVFYTKV